MTTVEDITAGQITAHGLGRRFMLRTVRRRVLKDVALGKDGSARRELWALRDVDLDVRPGETFGVVGKNGSGKSTLLKLIAGIFAPSEGTIAVGGRVGSLLGLGAGFDPDFSGVENVYLNAAVYGISPRYVDEHLDEIIAFAEVEDFAHVPMKTYSSGMFMRLGFAVAMHIDPDVLLIDEVLAVGDEAFQEKCFREIERYRAAGGTMIFVSHNASAVERLCDRAVLLEHGRMVESGSAEHVLREYHRRRTARPRDEERPAPGGERLQPAVSCEIVDVRAIDDRGEVRNSYWSGESVVLQAKLFSETGLEDARVIVNVCEADGRWLGARLLDGLALHSGDLATVRLSIQSLPLYQGSYAIDVLVETTEGARLATSHAAVQLAVRGNMDGARGIVRLGGEWEISGQAPEAARAAEG